jgi:hypothetical protein
VLVKRRMCEHPEGCHGTALPRPALNSRISALASTTHQRLVSETTFRENRESRASRERSESSASRSPTRTGDLRDMPAQNATVCMWHAADESEATEANATEAIEPHRMRPANDTRDALRETATPEGSGTVSGEQGDGGEEGEGRREDKKGAKGKGNEGVSRSAGGEREEGKGWSGAHVGAHVGAYCRTCHRSAIVGTRLCPHASKSEAAVSEVLSLLALLAQKYEY